MQSKNTKPSFWDRPIVVTLIGGVALSIITTGWSLYETNRQSKTDYERAIFKDIYIKEQIALIKTFPEVTKQTGQIIFELLAKMIEGLEEKNKKNNSNAKLKKIDDRIKKLEKDYRSAVPLEGILKQIQVVFCSETLRESAKKLYIIWQDYENLFSEINYFYVNREKEKIELEKLEDFKKRKKQLNVNIDILYKGVIEGMRYEMSQIRVGNIDVCPKQDH